MPGAIFWIAAGAGVAVVVVAVIFYTLILRRGRGLGTPGLVQRSRLTCPECHREFDYDWVPGGSFTAVRLGTGRYMACPLCQKWSYFNIYNTMITRPPATGDGSTLASKPGRPG